MSVFLVWSSHPFKRKTIQLNPTLNKTYGSVLWLRIITFILGLTRESTNPKTLDLDVIYDCTKVTSTGIFDYPPQRDCNHSINKTNDPVRKCSAEIHKYEAKASKFYVYHCQCSKITRSYYYKNIFKGPTI